MTSFILYVLPQEKSCEKAQEIIKLSGNTIAQVQDVRQVIPRPAWLKGVPTLLDQQNKYVWTGGAALEHLKYISQNRVIQSNPMGMINPQNTFDPQPNGTPNNQPQMNGFSTNQQPPLPNQQQPMVNQQPPLTNQQQPMVNQPPLTNQQQPMVNQPPQITNQQQPMVNQPPQITNQQQPMMTNQQQPMVNQQPLVTNQQPLVTNQQQPMVSQQPLVINQQQPMVNQSPQITNQQQPHLDDNSSNSQFGWPNIQEGQSTFNKYEKRKKSNKIQPLPPPQDDIEKPIQVQLPSSPKGFERRKNTTPPAQTSQPLENNQSQPLANTSV